MLGENFRHRINQTGEIVTSSVGGATTLHRTMRRLAPRIDVILGLAAVFLAASFVLFGTPVGLGLLFSGSAIGVLGVALAGLSWARQRSLRVLRATLQTTVENDATPCISADRNGFVVYANEAALSRFGPISGGSIVAILAELVASPGPLVRRIQAVADEQGRASEELALRRGTLRLQAHKVAADCLLWRFDDVQDRSMSTGVAAETLAIPMFVHAKSGNVPFMNEAMVRTLGRRDEELHTVDSDLPVRSGGKHK